MAGRVGQGELRLDPFVHRGLFARHFLLDRLPRWPEFGGERFGALWDELAALWARERCALPTANEAQTEERFIKPVLAALGFAFTVQAGVPFAGGRRQPDYALFIDDDARRGADRVEGQARYASAVAVADAKRFGRSLDGPQSGQERDDPVAQIINYVSITRRRWGILTNGRCWRLYAAEGDLVAGASYEVDLVALLAERDLDAFRYFAAFFGAAAHRPGADGRSFLDRVLAESQMGAIAVGDELERAVFAAVPLLVDGLLDDDERTAEPLAAAYEHALVVLFRLLFCLYAEARALLPVDNPAYRDYSLARQKQRLAADRDAGRVFSSRSTDLYNDLGGLFAIVALGDPDLGVNEYNGRLFNAARYPWLTGRSVPDSLLAPALDGIYRGSQGFVDYRDLSPRHLGTIYERLLDFTPVEVEGRIGLAPAAGRHDTGSYYTPEFVVDRIVEETLDPVLTRRSRAAASAGLRGDATLDALLAVRVLDPAMGSGHFLVSACAYIAQWVATDPGYDGELPLAELQRMVAERCLYGVDLNPMAVELARLSLWLTTVRGDEPLTFLHDLRHGDSLAGVWLADLLAGADDLFAQRAAGEVEELLRDTLAIGATASSDIGLVHEKERLAGDAERLRDALRGRADDAAWARGAPVAGRPLHWELEFPEVFLDEAGRRRDDGGFDAIVGNPPYVQIQSMGRDLAAFCRSRFATASGSFDLFVPFIERSLELLAPQGRLGFIVPNRIPRIDYAKRLRALLAEQRLVDEIVDFGDAQLFAGATNYTCLLVLDRGGRDELRYARLRGDAEDARAAMLDRRLLPEARFRADRLGADPWILATGEEAEVIAAAQDGAERLGDVTGGVFTGLQTSMDPVYVLEDRGRHGDRRRVFSRASGRELELEDDLLRPLASGADVGRYAFGPLRSVLLFPYRGRDAAMELLPPETLAELPLTLGYLREHEQALRGRERGRMDHARWYAYVYPKNLGAHDRPKLGVAQTVRRLEVAADPEGRVYFHNVRVNGILARDEGPSVWFLVALLNARLTDFVFRRGSVDMAGGHFAANKQFVVGLPVRGHDDAATAAAVEALGRRLHAAAAGLAAERDGFGRWLGDVLGTPLRGLPGAAAIARGGAEEPLDGLLDVLRANRSRLSRDPDARSFVELLRSEHAASADRLAALRAELGAAENEADELVYETYRIPRRLRVVVDGEYEPRPG